MKHSNSTNKDDEGEGFHGFNTVIDEIEAIKSLIEGNKKTSDSKAWKLEKKVTSLTMNEKKIEDSINVLFIDIQDVFCAIEG